MSPNRPPEDREDWPDRRLREAVRADFERSRSKVDELRVARLQRQFESELKTLQPGHTQERPAHTRSWIPRALAAGIVGLVMGGLLTSNWARLTGGSGNDLEVVLTVGEVARGGAPKTVQVQADDPVERASVLAETLVRSNVSFQVLRTKRGTEQQVRFTVPAAPDPNLARTLESLGVTAAPGEPVIIRFTSP
jgi:hypothetical protein